MHLNDFKYCHLTFVILFIKYSYLKEIIFTQLYGFKWLMIILSKWLNSFIWSINGTYFSSVHKWVLPIRVWMNLGIMAMKGYSTLYKAPELELHHQMGFCLIPRILIERRGVPFCRGVVDVFYSPNWQSKKIKNKWLKLCLLMKERRFKFSKNLCRKMIGELFGMIQSLGVYTKINWNPTFFIFFSLWVGEEG